MPSIVGQTLANAVGVQQNANVNAGMSGYAESNNNQGATVPSGLTPSQIEAINAEIALNTPTDPSGVDAATSGNSGGGGMSNSGEGGPDSVGGWARGGLSSLAAFARGGYSLGGYSDGGRLLRGPGDGVSDSIPATIADKRPARLADGEFVVPARIVSELGNGSTEAGARKLYAMMDRIQNARKKSVGKGKVAVNSRAEKLLPA
jgi:hypothetical protein